MKTFSKILRSWLHPPPGPRIQILSDLHLEVGQQYLSYTFPVSAPFLLLGGDIGRLVDYDGYLKFLETQVSRYEKVFLVLGNHEFCALDYKSGLEKALRLSEEPTIADRLILLNKTRWDDPNSNLTILGCTLCDFKKIDGWTAQKHNEVHSEEASWLRGQVAQVALQGGKTERCFLVATHHAPCISGSSRPEHSSNPWTPAFATDLVGQGEWNGVKTWVFGHTHYSTDFRRSGIRVVANQRGYVLPGSAAHTEEGNRMKKRDAHDFDPAMMITP